MSLHEELLNNDKRTTVRPFTVGRAFDEHYHENVRLDDGTNIFIRTLHAEDKACLLDGFERMSPESRFKRFFSYKETLSRSELEYFTEIDGENHMALAAGRFRPDGTVEGLGVARFVRSGNKPEEAEPAVAVVDAWQRRGVGRVLLDRLVGAAAEREIHEFVGSVLADNEAMIALLRKSSFTHLSYDQEYVNFRIDVYRAELNRHVHSLRDVVRSGRFAAMVNMIKNRLVQSIGL